LGQQYLGEIRLMGFNFAPKGWAQCTGQILSIQQNTALFALLGTYYGGNGVNTFALPDLRSRVANHMGTPPGGPTYVIGQVAGVENVRLLANQLGSHTHALQAVNTAGDAVRPVNNFLAQSAAGAKVVYASPTNLTSLNPASIQPAGDNLPHTNIQPYLALNYCIALQGIFPSRG
jgi:microcystin-dependent protein